MGLTQASFTSRLVQTSTCTCPKELSFACWVCNKHIIEFPSRTSNNITILLAVRFWMICHGSVICDRSLFLHKFFSAERETHFIKRYVLLRGKLGQSSSASSTSTGRVWREACNIRTSAALIQNTTPSFLRKIQPRSLLNLPSSSEEFAIARLLVIAHSLSVS